jgi:NAD(P)H-dependent FMN reductase
MDQQKPLIKIVTGSSRPGRFSNQPANWLLDIAKSRTDLNVELIDVAELNLPFLDESAPAMMHQYSKEHTKNLAKTSGEADGFVFITPEYNHSYSPVLKNMIDYLNLEWNYKPVAFVSYGSAAGGSRAVEHLRGVAGELKMYDIRDQILFNSYYENLDEQGNYKFTESQTKQANDLLDSLTFWSIAMSEARQKMSS